MTKLEIWSALTIKNPAFDRERVTLSSSGLKKLFLNAYDAGYERGYERGSNTAPHAQETAYETLLKTIFGKNK